MEEELSSIIRITYIARDHTVGHKEPQMLYVLRTNGESDYYDVPLPEDVGLFIEDRCTKPFYEADYSFCLESIIMEEFVNQFEYIKKKAMQMQVDLTRAQKFGSIQPVQENLSLPTVMR